MNARARLRYRLAAIRIGAACFAVLCLGAVRTTAAPLRVGTSGDYAPFSVRDATDTFTGFDLVVARRLAADLGRPLVVEPFRWPDLVTRLRAGDFDIAMSGVTVRADRALDVAFTRPYAVSGAVAVIRAADRVKYRRVAALDQAAVRIGVNAGGHLERVARAQFPHAELTVVTDNATLPDVLQRREVDAVISEEFEARVWARAGFATIGPFTRDRKAYAVPLHNTELRNQVDAWLAAREADGWLDGQRTKILGPFAHKAAGAACIEAVAAAIDLRLQLMPFVARAKRHAKVPMVDTQQEAAVLEHVRVAAKELGLQSGPVVELFRVQIDAAKAVQARADDTSLPDTVALTEVRVAVATVSDQLLHELARCAQWLQAAATQTRLDRTIRTDTVVRDLPSPLRERLLSALHRIRRAGLKEKRSANVADDAD